MVSPSFFGGIWGRCIVSSHAPGLWRLYAKALDGRRFPFLIKGVDIHMETTKNYGLPKWEKSDFIQMNDFNDAFAKLDAALKQNADATAEKADGAATQQALRSLQSSLGTGGRTCRIACGSYTGSGEYGETHPNTLQFDFTPVFLVVGSDSYGLIGSSRFLRPLALGSDQSGNRQVVSWGEKSVSWYFPGTENGHVWQNNTKDYVYHYVAIGYDAK